jgi:hypothetical protein
MKKLTYRMIQHFFDREVRKDSKRESLLVASGEKKDFKLLLEGFEKKVIKSEQKYYYPIISFSIFLNKSLMIVTFVEKYMRIVIVPV